MKLKPKKRWRLLFFLYLAAVLIWLLCCGVPLARDSLHTQNGQMPAIEIAPEDFTETQMVIWLEDGRMLSTEGDPQLIYSLPRGVYCGRLVFYGTPLRNLPGEMVVYWAKEGQPFTERNKVWPTQQADGGWVFDLGGRKLERIRLDFADVNSSIWTYDGLVLNTYKPPWAYFLPSAQTLALLLLLPPLCYAAVRELLAFLEPIFARRKLESRWRGEMAEK